MQQTNETYGILEVLDSPVGLEYFYSYMKKDEINKQNLLGYLSLKQIIIDTEENPKSFKTIVNTRKWIKKFNFSSNESKIKSLKILKKELTEEKGDSFKSTIKEVYKEIRLLMGENFYRFKKTQQFKDFLQKDFEIQKNSFIPKMFENTEESYIMNDYFEWPLFLPKNDPNYIAKELLERFLRLINNNEAVWEVTNQSLSLSYSSLLSLYEFTIVRQMTVELGFYLH
jgi:hypothetical protein